MSAHIPAIFALITSIVSLIMSVFAITYFFFAIEHWPTHVYEAQRIEQALRTWRTYCTGTKSAACAELKPIEPPPGYADIMTVR